MTELEKAYCETCKQFRYHVNIEGECNTCCNKRIDAIVAKKISDEKNIVISVETPAGTPAAPSGETPDPAGEISQIIDVDFKQDYPDDQCDIIPAGNIPDEKYDASIAYYSAPYEHFSDWGKALLGERSAEQINNQEGYL